MAYHILWPENYGESDQLQGESTPVFKISKGRTVEVWSLENTFTLIKLFFNLRQ